MPDYAIFYHNPVILPIHAVLFTSFPVILTHFSLILCVENKNMCSNPLFVPHLAVANQEHLFYHIITRVTIHSRYGFRDWIVVLARKRQAVNPYHDCEAGSG